MIFRQYDDEEKPEEVSEEVAAKVLTDNYNMEWEELLLMLKAGVNLRSPSATYWWEFPSHYLNLCTLT